MSMRAEYQSPEFPGFDLERFVSAQNSQYDSILSELKRGDKRTHWMWFVFPQMAGLGYSEMSEFYGIESMEEAEAYLEHPVLGLRLRDCVALVLNVDGRSIQQIFGTTDAMKFRSCVTLFAHAAPCEPLFRLALEKYFGGVEDSATLKLIQ
jgi:uncharacterized protein (DUF1810 family)